MSAVELQEWRQYEELEPFGQIRDNYHAAMVCHILANAHRGRNSQPVPMSNFFYVDRQTRQEQEERAMVAFMDSKANRAEN